MTASTIFHKLGVLGRKLISLAFWLFIWQVVAMAVGQELLIPAPRLVFARLWELGQTADFWLTAGSTLLRIFIGFLGGVLAGTLLAVCTSASRAADMLLSPAVRVMRATPVASFILLMLLWIGTGLVPSVIAALIVVPILWGNVTKGIRETDKSLLEMGRVFGFSPFKQMRLIYFPSVLPYFTSGCSTGLGLAWKSGVAAEVLCLPKQAVGTQVYYSKLYLETPSLFAWTLLVIVLSFLVEGVWVFVLNRLMRRWDMSQKKEENSDAGT